MVITECKQCLFKKTRYTSEHSEVKPTSETSTFKINLHDIDISGGHSILFYAISALYLIYKVCYKISSCLLNSPNIFIRV